MYNEHSESVVTGSSFTGNTAGNGGGGMANFHTGMPSVTDCVFEANHAGNGGGMYNSSSMPLVVHCTFVANTASRGGGIGNHDGNAHVESCTFTANVASSQGGGLYDGNMYGSGTYVTDSVFEQNSSGAAGGAVYAGPLVEDDNLTIVNSVFVDNHSDFGGAVSGTRTMNLKIINSIFARNTAVTGGGAYSVGAINIGTTMTNCTFFENSAGVTGGAILTGGRSWQEDLLITNCILWGNSAPEGPEMSLDLEGTISIDYSDVQGGQSSIHVDPDCNLDWGPGMIDTDPFFLDSLNDDYRLTFASPCIDAGDNDAPSLPDRDFEGDPRVFHGNGKGGHLGGSPPPGAFVDMGADEYCLMKRTTLTQR
jgi:predicted outer membrane repeat protein